MVPIGNHTQCAQILPFELKNMRIKTYSSNQKVASMSIFGLTMSMIFERLFCNCYKRKVPLEDPELRREMQVAPHGQKCERGRGRH